MVAVLRRNVVVVVLVLLTVAVVAALLLLDAHKLVGVLLYYFLRLPLPPPFEHRLMFRYHPLGSVLPQQYYC